MLERAAPIRGSGSGRKRNKPDNAVISGLLSSVWALLPAAAPVQADEPAESNADKGPAPAHAGKVAAPLQRGFVPGQLCILGVKLGRLLISTVASARSEGVDAEGGGNFWEGRKVFGKKKGRIEGRWC
jgi:hypothetical protein